MTRTSDRPAKPHAMPTLDSRGTLKMVLDEGGPGMCLFTITNACNARCRFCGFSHDLLPRREWRFLDLTAARDAIDILYTNGVRYLAIQGGEPTLHADLAEIIAHAAALDMQPLLVTNGLLLTQERVRQLVAAGVSGFVISIDAMDVGVHEANRGLPGLCARIRTANQAIVAAGLVSTASVTMSRLVEYEKIPAFLQSLGFHSVTFSYPLTHLGSSYLSFSDSELVDLNDAELIDAFEQIKQLKKHFHVLNSLPSIEEMQRFIRGEKQIYPCLGGFKYFYMDWELLLWRCHYWHEPMCSIYDFDGSQRVRDGCTKCMIDCFRDSSVLHHIGVTLHDAYRSLQRLEFARTLKVLLQPNNVGSIRAVLEELPWIIKMNNGRSPHCGPT